MSIVGILCHLFFPQPIKVLAKNHPNILNACTHHEETVHAQVPMQSLALLRQVAWLLRAEDSGAAEFYPAVTFFVGAEFYAGFGEWEVVGFEADFVCAGNFHRELA